MKLNKKKVLVLLLIIVIVSIILRFNITKEPVVQGKEENKIEEIKEVEKIEEIEEIKEDTGMTANDELYEIQVEYDGKKVLNIKPEIQYKIAFAGIIKNKIPEINEIDKIFKEEYPKETGIWIDATSREKFLEILNNNTNNKYKITEQGYLIIEEELEPNDIDKSIKTMIEGKNKLIVSISGIYYQVDRVTGEILDNFFEEMDPFQSSKIVEWDDNVIIILSTNKEGKLTDKEILQDLIP